MPQGGTIELVGNGNVDDAWQTAVLAGLTSHGFVRSDHGRYLVQLTASDLPGKTGLLAPDDSGEAKAEWLVAPSRSRAIGARVVTLVMSDAATGREVYRIVAQQPQRIGKPDATDRLSRAFLTELDGTASSRPAGEGG